MGNRCLPGTGGSSRCCRSRSSSLAGVQVTALGQPRPPGALPVPGGRGSRRRGRARAEQPSGSCRAGDGWSGAAARRGPGTPRGWHGSGRPGTGSASRDRDNKLRFANSALHAAPWGLAELRETALPEPARCSGNEEKNPDKEGETKGRKGRIEGLARCLFVLHQAGV